MVNAAIICTRSESSRLPGKALMRINGVPVLHHLVARIRKSGIPVIIAYPREEPRWEEFDKIPDAISFQGVGDDPLKRMYDAAKKHKVENIVRITHDKIFIDPDQLLTVFSEFKKKGLDYIYTDQATEGTAFEIISFKALKEAAGKYKGVEHISYAIKAVTQNQSKYSVPVHLQSSARLLLDYPSDVSIMEAILSACGNTVSLGDALAFIETHNLYSLNRLPVVTVYTCAHNAEEYIEECLTKTINQSLNVPMEIICIDDASQDMTFAKMAKIKAQHPDMDITLIKNQDNVGLSSSSNIALRHARGRYIVRMDADDFFWRSNSLHILLTEIIQMNKDVIYPNNKYGESRTGAKIQYGHEHHHIGGAIFNTRAINHIKFTDRLRGYEGLDFFYRAHRVLNIGYLNTPIFFYRQHPNSMSKTNLAEREQLREMIKQQYEDTGLH